MQEEPAVTLDYADRSARAMQKRSVWLSAFGIGGIATAIGGGVFFVAVASSSRTAGATRSFQLKWEQRQQQIEEAVRTEDAARMACMGDRKDPR